MTSKSVIPDEVLDAIKGDSTLRTQRSLDILHQICREQHERGSLDFSVATIGRLSAAAGGPATQSIRNREGARYRELLAAWAAFCDGHKKKPPAVQSPTFGNDLLNAIADASVRALVGVVLAENRKLKAENALLKNRAEVVIDKRRLPAPKAKSAEVIPAASLLLPAELAALQDSIANETVARHGWTVDEATGRVTKDGRPIFKAGFVTALRKVLGENSG